MGKMKENFTFFSSTIALRWKPVRLTYGHLFTHLSWWTLVPNKTPPIGPFTVSYIHRCMARNYNIADGHWILIKQIQGQTLSPIKSISGYKYHDYSLKCSKFMMIDVEIHWKISFKTINYITFSASESMCEKEPLLRDIDSWQITFTAQQIIRIDFTAHRMYSKSISLCRIKKENT